MQEDAIELLSKGSVWSKKEGKKAGVQVKVLWITNESLSPKAQEKHPCQVIYANAEGDVYNRDVSDFIEQYAFYNVDPELEERLEELLTFNAEDYDDAGEEDEDGATGGLVVSEEPAPRSLADELADEGNNDFKEVEPEPTMENAGLYPDSSVLFVMGQGEATTLSAEQLNYALVAYSQEPNKEFSIVQHRLLFRLSSTVTLQALVDAFLPTDGKATVDSFAVSSPHYQELINWTDYIGVFPEIAQGRAFASVLVGEEAIQAPASSGEVEFEAEQVGVVDPAEQTPEQIGQQVIEHIEQVIAQDQAHHVDPVVDQAAQLLNLGSTTATQNNEHQHQHQHPHNPEAPAQ